SKISDLQGVDDSMGFLVKIAQSQAGEYPVSGGEKSSPIQCRKDDCHNNKENGGHENATAGLLEGQFSHEPFESADQQTDRSNRMRQPSRISEQEVGQRADRECCTVRAVYDRPRCPNCKIVGGHGPPLQKSNIRSTSRC